METATLCDPDTPEAGVLEATAFFVISLDNKPTSQQVLILGSEARHTNRGQRRNRTFASGNMRFASCSALRSILASWQCN